MFAYPENLQPTTYNLQPITVISPIQCHHTRCKLIPSNLIWHDISATCEYHFGFRMSNNVRKCKFHLRTADRTNSPLYRKLLYQDWYWNCSTYSIGTGTFTNKQESKNNVSNIYLLSYGQRIIWPYVNGWIRQWTYPILELPQQKIQKISMDEDSPGYLFCCKSKWSSLND